MMLSNIKQIQKHKQTIDQLVDQQHNILLEIIYVILSEQSFDILQCCVWLSFGATTQVSHVISPFSVDNNLYFGSLSLLQFTVLYCLRHLKPKIGIKSCCHYFETHQTFKYQNKEHRIGHA